MILTSHMLVGAALGAHLPNIWTAFGLGLVSHYLLDAIAHWDYLSYVNIKNAVHRQKISIDLAILIITTLILVWWLGPKTIILAGILGALLPDGFELLYKNFGFKWLKPLSNFHLMIHNNQRLSLSEGLPSLILVSLAAIFVLFL